MDELELKLETRTHDELIDARALRDALEAMLALLRTESNPATWRITDLQMGSNICAIRPDHAYDTGRLRGGLDTIREGRIPANWSVSGLRAAQTLGRLEGRRNVTGVKITSRASGQQMRFDRSLAQQIDSILSPDAATTWSMISGRVVAWKSNGHLQVDTRNQKIHVQYDDSTRELALSIVDKVADVWGRVSKDVEGRITVMFLDGAEVIDPPSASPLDDLVGCMRGVEGFPQSVDEWLLTVRHGE